jgi:DNA polymerase-3 subunit epsilon
VRSYFGTGETRRKVHAMLRQVRDVRYIATPDPLTAEVYESRLIARLLPQYNRTGTRADSYRYLRLANERGRLRAVNTRKTGGDGAYLGPISSRRMAESVADAVASVLPRFDESSDPSADVDAALAALADDPGSIAAAIERRMTALSAEQRFEDAALARDRLRAFVLTVSRRRLADQLRAAGRLHVESGGVHYLLDHGVLTSVRRDGELFSPSATSTAGDDLLALVNPPEPPCDLSLPPPTACFDELLLVARHLGAHGAVVHSATGDWSSRLESSRRALLAEVPNGRD